MKFGSEINRGRGLTFIKFNRGRIGQFGIGTIWIYLPDQAANAAIRWFFTEKGGKGDYGWLLRGRQYVNPVLVPPVLVCCLVGLNGEQ